MADEIVRRLITELDVKVNQSNYQAAEAGFSKLKSLAGSIGVSAVAGASTGIGMSLQRADRLIKNFAGSEGIREITNLAIIPTVDKAAFRKAAGSFLEEFDELDTFKSLAPFAAKLATNVGTSLGDVSNKFASFITTGNVDLMKQLGLVSSQQIEQWKKDGVKFEEMFNNMRKGHLINTFILPNAAKINKQYAESLEDVDVQAAITKKGLVEMADKIFLYTAPAIKSGLQLTNAFFDTVANDPFGEMLIKATAASVGIMGIGIAFTAAGKLAALAKIGGPLLSLKTLKTLGKGGAIAALVISLQDLYTTLSDPKADTQLRKVVNELERLNEGKFEETFPAISNQWKLTTDSMAENWDTFTTKVNSFSGIDLSGGLLGFLNSALKKIDALIEKNDELQIRMMGWTVMIQRLTGYDHWESYLPVVQSQYENLSEKQKKGVAGKMAIRQIDEVKNEIMLNQVKPGETPGFFSNASDLMSDTFSYMKNLVTPNKTPVFGEQGPNRVLHEHRFLPITGSLQLDGLGRVYSVDMGDQIDESIKQYVKEFVEFDYRKAYLGTGD